jgi:chromate transporter
MDVAIAVAGFTLLAAWRVSALFVVLWCVLASVIGALLF